MQNPVKVETKGIKNLKDSTYSFKEDINIKNLSPPNRIETPKKKRLLTTLEMGGLKVPTFGLKTTMNPLLKGVLTNRYSVTTPKKDADCSTQDNTPIKNKEKIMNKNEVTIKLFPEQSNEGNLAFETGMKTGTDTDKNNLNMNLNKNYPIMKKTPVSRNVSSANMPVKFITKKNFEKKSQPSIESCSL